MTEKELDLTKQVIELSNKILDDKQKEREASTKKAFYQTAVTIAVIICFGALWLYEIHESYCDVNIQNTSTSITERRDINEQKT